MEDIDWTTGKPAVAYVNQVPWYGYGYNMPYNASFDEWITAAQLNYNVLEKPIFTQDRIQEYTAVPKKKALQRDDTLDVLGIVSEGYKVVQPREVVYFFEDLVEKLGYEMETMGALGNGDRVWALARTHMDFSVLQKADPMKSYLLLATSYSGKFSTTAQFTSVRVVCNNTLTYSLSSENGGVVRIPHSQEFDAQAVKDTLLMTPEERVDNEFNINKLADTHITKEQAIEFYMDLMGFGENKENAKQTYTVKKLLECYTSAPGQELETAHDTAWGLLNGVTYFTDHARRAKNQGNRLNSAWFGNSAELKKKAYNKALELVA